MPKVYRPQEVIKVLESFGWSVTRQHSSHVIMTKAGERNNISVPASRREVAIGTFRKMLDKAGLTPSEFDQRASEVL
jgi:predicted RNA binding protein YcfA (HicA-like mRNA interferase family)